MDGNIYIDIWFNKKQFGKCAFDNDKRVTSQAEEFFKTILGDGYRERGTLFDEYAQLIRKSTPSARIVWTGEFLTCFLEVCKLKFTETYYVCSKFSKNSFFYVRLDDEDLKALLSGWYRFFWGYSTGKEIRDMTATVESNVERDSLLPSIDRRYIMITNDLLWDRDRYSILKTENIDDSNNVRVMTKMFKTSDPDKNIVKIPEFNEEQIQLMMETYEQHKDIPVEKYEMDLEPIKDWSGGVRGKYQDMLYAACSSFLRVLPRYAFMPIGIGKNGKSAFEGMIGSVIGKDNIGNIPHEECMTWDHLYSVQTIWMNCPGETPDDFFSKNTDSFKIMAAHESKTCKKKGSSIGVNIKHEYMQFINENEMPTFGKDVKALLDRIYPIRFSVDFSENPIDDYANKAFVEDREYMPRLVGQILAMAHYYSQEDHKWTISQEAKAELDTIKEYAAPNVGFYNKFVLFFSEYDKFKTVQKEYLNYGNLNGEEYSPKDVSSSDLYFSNYKHRVSNGKHKYVIKDGGSVNRIAISDKFRSRTLTDNTTLEEFHKVGGSLLSRLEAEFVSCKEKKRKELNSMLVTEEEKKQMLQDKLIAAETLKIIAEKDSSYGYRR